MGAEFKIVGLGSTLAALIALGGASVLRAQAPAPAASPAASGSPPTATTLSDWIDSPDAQARLAGGKVVLSSSLDERDARASADAAIRIQATAAQVWPLITRCRFAGLLIPGLRGCRVLQRASDGSWETIEHDIKYSFFTPMVHSVFRADLHAPYRMDFHRIRGNLKYEVGSWTLQPGTDGSVTVEYRVTMQPGFWVPRSMVRHSLRKQLPAALVALRNAAERSAPAAVAADARG
ncbi:MAG: SRPBCC family protein, partial [Steroidobacteraceae bacterium]